MNDTITVKEESEERNAAKDKLVASSGFHPGEGDSSSPGSTAVKIGEHNGYSFFTSVASVKFMKEFFHPQQPRQPFMEVTAMS